MSANVRQQQQNKLVLDLRNKDSYAHEVYSTKNKVHETPISWVFLTGLYAYKIKKEGNLGKFEFSTLQLRRKFCQKEIEVNSILCNDMYKRLVKLESK
jgi:aminoglycoside phosphotransferase family enzyme